MYKIGKSRSVISLVVSSLLSRPDEIRSKRPAAAAGLQQCSEVVGTLVFKRSIVEI